MTMQTATRLIPQSSDDTNKLHVSRAIVQPIRIPSLLLQVVYVVVDEIGNAKEVAAIKDIASRGVAMVATVHGTSLKCLLENPVLSPLVCSKQRMVIGDFAAAQ